jgi:hypothetical protein
LDPEIRGGIGPCSRTPLPPAIVAGDLAIDH